MIISTKTRVQFRGVTCTRTFDYYATAAGSVMCEITYTPVAYELRDLRGHETVQVLDLRFAPAVCDAMMFLGLELDNTPAAELFAALAISSLPAGDCGESIASYISDN
nr:MAG TPA: hypothetical protein [Caudoviricetes sp.]